MEPQGRTIDALFCTRRQSKTLCPERTTLRVRDYVQTVGLNAETKKGPASSRRGNVCVDIPFYRAFPHRHRGSAAPAPRHYLPVAQLRPRFSEERLPHPLRGPAIS